MTDPSPDRKKKRITITASPKGVEIAENALIRLGFDSKSNFAKSQLLARTTVTKFFKGEPIQLDSFKRICEALKLNWKGTAGLTEETQPKQLPTSSYSSPDSDGVAEQVQLEHRKVTVIDKQSKKIKAAITLEGDIDSVQNWKFIQSVLREYSGDTIEITDIKEGSIRLFVEGSPEDIKRLVSRIESGELKTVAGFSVEDVQIFSENLDDESTKSDEKWHLVQEIVSQVAIRQDLSSADLSDANLSSANLSSANLSCADLSNADLSNADLSNADLSNADLSDADLSNADLSDANLSDADLSNANLSRANLNRADLSRADLSRADLSHANLGHANLSHTNLSHANLSRADLSHTDLSSINLSHANLSRAYLSRGNLSAIDLSNINLSNINLSAIDLSDINLSHANLSHANLSDAYLSGAYLIFTNLSDADLSGANLSSANLSGANLSRGNLSRADLSNANLSHANLSHANLSNTNLSNTNLRGTIVANALFGSNMGLAEDMKRDLEQRGAIFGDRPPVLNPK